MTLSQTHFDAMVMAKGNNTMVKLLHWILGVLAGLGLVVGLIFKLIYNIAGVIVFYTTPKGCLLFTATCCLASIALSMIELSSKLRDIPETRDSE